jgi:hypothetical protein
VVRSRGGLCRLRRTGSYIREYEAGWIVSPDDPEGIARTLRQILASPEEARRRGANAQRLARERLNWSAPSRRWTISAVLRGGDARRVPLPSPHRLLWKRLLRRLLPHCGCGIDCCGVPLRSQARRGISPDAGKFSAANAGPFRCG